MSEAYRGALIKAAADALDRMELPGVRSCVGLRKRTERLTELFLDAMFPAHSDTERAETSQRLAIGAAMLECSLLQAGDADPAGTTDALLAALPELRRQLGTDLNAAYRGDPATTSFDEIILCYPAFRAIATYRLAHVLYCRKAPILPRVMTEYAHRLTGIDIHPGAVIGDDFFIDHGTGVVIGETATIGRDVKLYQHVTIGAKSFEAGEDGVLVKGVKRHPDIGDRVVIYAGATILGGDTRIGDDCVIGGSVWLTKSVPAGTTVLSRPAELSMK